ncbi:MAG: DUF362 domain-containing protein [Elusimicrobiota bacterium]|jgi:uncharacterized protein (DUF362 family)/Pyruvate/2-oxoacid:ferredoxin oxidoreductase delta subunit|nr:DUF362 domain-containing protein [Elusimicrobiota bacterium]
MTKISVVKCNNYKQSQEAVERAISLIGGIETFVKAGEKILIKPNLLAPRDPSQAITTHPEIVRAMIRLVKKAGATPIVGDSPGGSIRDIKNLWKVTGMTEVCTDEEVQLVQFEAEGAKSIDIGNPNIKPVTFSNAVLDCDGIINLPKLKTHSLMKFTGGVKNFYGTIPGLLKVEYHKYASKTKDFSDLLANIYTFLKPKIRLTLIDSVLAMDGAGPSAGNVKELNFIAASQDTAELDAFLLTILGYNISKYYLLKKLNITKKTVAAFEIAGDSIRELGLGGFKFPRGRMFEMAPKFMVKFLGKFLWIKPFINEDICRKCLICGKSCPVKAIHIGKHNCPTIDKTLCISCFCCHEMCPYKAIGFKKSLLAKLFIQDDANPKH